METHDVQERYLPRFGPLETVLQDIVGFLSPFLPDSGGGINQVDQLVKDFEKILPNIEQFYVSLNQIVTALESMVQPLPERGPEPANLLQRCQTAFKRLKEMAASGEALPPELLQTINERLNQFQLASHPPASVSASVAVVRTRQEAERALEAAGQYFRQQEPSSPVPMLLARARRWSGLSFREILLDLELGDTAMEKVDSVLRPDRPQIENPGHQQVDMGAGAQESQENNR